MYLNIYHKVVMQKKKRSHTLAAQQMLKY